MSRTGPLPLLLLAIGGAIAGFLLQLGLASFGAAVFTPPFTLPLTVIVAGILIVVAAIPVYRSIRSPFARRVNPFGATRILMMAKASSRVGSLIIGFSLGLVLYHVTRAALPESPSLWLAVATVFAGVMLTTAGIVAEALCALPPEDPDDGASPA